MYEVDPLSCPQFGGAIVLRTSNACIRAGDLFFHSLYNRRLAMTPSSGLLAVAYKRLGIRPAK